LRKKLFVCKTNQCTRKTRVIYNCMKNAPLVVFTLNVLNCPFLCSFHPILASEMCNLTYIGIGCRNWSIRAHFKFAGSNCRRLLSTLTEVSAHFCDVVCWFMVMKHLISQIQINLDGLEAPYLTMETWVCHGVLPLDNRSVQCVSMKLSNHPISQNPTYLMLLIFYPHKMTQI
jgi:hypothetical protein